MTVKEISVMKRSNMCNIHTEKKTERTQEEITISEIRQNHRVRMEQQC